MKLQDVKSFNAISFKGLGSELPSVLKLKSQVSQVASKIFSTLRDLYLKITDYVFGSEKRPLITCSNSTPDNLNENCDKDRDKDLELSMSLNTEPTVVEGDFFEENNDPFIEKSVIEKTENHNLDPDVNVSEQSEGLNFSDMFVRGSAYIRNVEIHKNFQIPNISEKVTKFFKGFFSKPNFFSTFSYLFSQKISQQQVKAVFSQSKANFKNTESKNKDSFVATKKSEDCELSVQTDEIEIQQIPKQPSMDRSDLTESNPEKGSPASEAESVDPQKPPATCNADNFSASSTSNKMDVNAFIFLAGNLSSACKQKYDDLWQAEAFPVVFPDLRGSFGDATFSTSAPQKSSSGFFESFLSKFNPFNLFSKFSFSKKSEDFSQSNKGSNVEEELIQEESSVDSLTVTPIKNISFSTNDTCFSDSEDTLDTSETVQPLTQRLESDQEDPVHNLQTIEGEDNPIEEPRFKLLNPGSTISSSSDLIESVTVSSQSSSNGFTEDGSANNPNEPVLPPIPPLPLHLKGVVDEYRKTSSCSIEDLLDSARPGRIHRRYVSPDTTPRTPVLSRFRNSQNKAGVERSTQLQQLLQYVENSPVNTPRSSLVTPRSTLKSLANRSVYDWRGGVEAISDDLDVSNVPELASAAQIIPSSIRQENAAQSNQQPARSTAKTAVKTASDAFNGLNQAQSKQLKTSAQSNQQPARSTVKKVVKTAAAALSSLNQAQSKQSKASPLVVEDSALRLYVKNQPHSKYGTTISGGAFYLTPENMAKAIADLESLRNAEYQEHQQKTRAALQVTPKVNAMSNVVVTDPAAIEILKNAPQFKYGHKIRNGVYEVSNDRLELLLEAVKSQKAQSRPKFR